MRVRYTPELLDEVFKRDNAVLVFYNGLLSKRTPITFICHCGKESSKLGYDLIKRTGAYCKECALQRGIEKTKRTLKERYNKVPICTIESLHTTIQRDHASLLNEYMSVTNNTIIYFRCNCNKESEKNCLQLIGVSGAFCEKCTRIKWTQNTKKTNLERYGVECTAQAPEVKERIIQSNLKNYGVKNVFESKEVIEKIKSTHIKRYGVEHYTKTEECKRENKRDKSKTLWG